MQNCNYHTHSTFSDGADTPESIVRHAIDIGLEGIGISDHAPILKYGKKWNMSYDKQDEYVTKLNELKEKYSSKIKVFCSLEIDYIPDVVNPTSDFLPHHAMDYTIGSIHYMGYLKNGNLWGFELLGKELQRGLHEHYRGNAIRLVEDYYQNMRDMIIHFTPDIIGHIDRIRIINKIEKFFQETDNWYQDQLKETLKTLAESKSILEINTKSVYSGEKDPYPTYNVLKIAQKLNIPIVLSSDAHQAQYLIGSFEEVYTEIEKTGYNNWAVINKP